VGNWVFSKFKFSPFFFKHPFSWPKMCGKNEGRCEGEIGNLGGRTGGPGRTASRLPPPPIGPSVKGGKEEKKVFPSMGIIKWVFLGHGDDTWPARQLAGAPRRPSNYRREC